MKPASEVFAVPQLPAFVDRHGIASLRAGDVGQEQYFEVGRVGLLGDHRMNLLRTELIDALALERVGSERTGRHDVDAMLLLTGTTVATDGSSRWPITPCQQFGAEAFERGWSKCGEREGSVVRRCCLCLLACGRDVVACHSGKFARPRPKQAFQRGNVLRAGSGEALFPSADGLLGDAQGCR